VPNGLKSYPPGYAEPHDRHRRRNRAARGARRSHARSERLASGHQEEIDRFAELSRDFQWIVQRWTVEVEGSEKPACVAESVGRVLV